MCSLSDAVAFNFQKFVLQQFSRPESIHTCQGEHIILCDPLREKGLFQIKVQFLIIAKEVQNQNFLKFLVLSQSESSTWWLYFD